MFGVFSGNNRIAKNEQLLGRENPGPQGFVLVYKKNSHYIERACVGGIAPIVAYHALTADEAVNVEPVNVQPEGSQDNAPSCSIM